jgi:hypothetical protein
MSVGPQSIRIVFSGSSRTLLQSLHPGIPLSLLNDQNCRDEAAINPVIEQAPTMIIIANIVAVPAFEPVPWAKIYMAGKPVGDLSASLRFVRQNRRAMVIPKPSAPLIRTLNKIALGTTTGAFWTSSAIYGQVSQILRIAHRLLT